MPELRIPNYGVFPIDRFAHTPDELLAIYREVGASTGAGPDGAVNLYGRRGSKRVRVTFLRHYEVVAEQVFDNADLAMPFVADNWHRLGRVEE